ncbi:MAG: phosphoribosylformylglycinamidine synthase subunit PurQ [Nitriliruptorales bacterium]|nr:phosphoribosylformylglycinamidine synthase subunit PurQ [Nitriliruptorales bacterium]
MRVGVVRFPGSCDERDAAYALEMVGAEPVLLWHGEAGLQGVEAVVLPGGFSYGDYLRTGALAQFAPVMESVADFAARGGPVLGICNGFQILCEAGLLPGALTRNAGLRFVHRLQTIRIETRCTWTAGVEVGAVLTVPVKHGEGRFVADDVDALAARGQILARYCEPDGAVTDAADPNGSQGHIAGVTNAAGNVAGLMPHPEHAVDAMLGGTDGRLLLGAVLSAVATR